MREVTLLASESPCIDGGKLVALVKGAAPTSVKIDGILGRMRRKMLPIVAHLVERHYDSRVNEHGGVDVIERLEPLDDIDCWMDIKTGSIYRRDNGRCLSSAQLWLA